MADKIAKLLAKLSSKQRTLILAVIQKLIDNDLTGLDIKSLQGKSGLYRVRVGDYRIIFSNDVKRGIMIRSIAKRDERTYKNV